MTYSAVIAFFSRGAWTILHYVGTVDAIRYLLCARSPPILTQETRMKSNQWDVSYEWKAVTLLASDSVWWAWTDG